MTAHEAQLESALEALARLALEQDSKLRDAVAEALEQMTAALGDMQAKHAEQYEAVRKERDEARADAARLQEALTQVRDAMRATGQEPDGDDDPRRPVATAVWHALASAPSTEPTPRDMRVAKVTP